MPEDGHQHMLDLPQTMRLILSTQMTPSNLPAPDAASPKKDVCTTSIITPTRCTEKTVSARKFWDSDQLIGLENQINELGLKIDAFAAERKAIVESVGLAALEVEPNLEVTTSSYYLLGAPR